MSTIVRTPLGSARVLLFTLLVACGSRGAATTPTLTAPASECPTVAVAAEDARVVTLLGRASTSFAQGDHASAVALLRAAASLGPSPLDDAATRTALVRLPLPTVVSPSTSVHERSADGTVVAFITPPAALSATSDLRTLCDASPLEWADLARGTRGSIPLTPLAASTQLAPLLALDAHAAAGGHLVRSLQSADDCEFRVDLCGGEPRQPREVEYLAGHAAPALVPRHERCGRVEALSAHGQWAIVALPEVREGRMGQGLCRFPSRLAWDVDPAHMVCVATRYVVISLADGRVALEAAHTTDAIRISEDERYAYVRAADSAGVTPLAPGLSGVTLAEDCRGAVAFAPNGQSFVAVCGQRLDVVSLGATVSTRSVPLDRRGLAPFGEEVVVAVATTPAVDQFALVFAPSPPQGRRVQHRWAVLDANGRVTDRVHEAAPIPQRVATSVSPVVARAATLPVVRGGWAGLCGAVDSAYHGQTLTRATGAGARFVSDDLVLWGRGEDTPAEVWSRRPASMRGRNARWSFVETWRASDAGELLFVEPPTDRSGWRLVFADTRYSLVGDAQPTARPGHDLGPARWDAPEAEGRDAETVEDLAALLRATGSRTNLRVCPDDLRVVAVLPRPAPDTVWADRATCAQPAAASSDGEWRCRAGQI